MCSPSDDERGSVSAMVVCLVSALVTLGVFVFESGRFIDGYMRTSDVAENAARMAAQSIVGIRAGAPRVDQRSASESGRDYLASEGLSGIVTTSGGGITVSVVFRWAPRVLPFMGKRNIPITRSAQLVDG